LSVFVSYIHIFCYVNLEEQSTKLKIVTFYCIMLVENILLIALWTLGEQYTNGLSGWHRDRIFIAVFSSFFLGLIFMVIYYKFLSREKDGRCTGVQRAGGSGESSQEPAVAQHLLLVRGRPRRDRLQLRAQPGHEEEEEASDTASAKSGGRDEHSFLERASAQRGENSRGRAQL
jgi:hypothetical protein